MSLRGPAFSFRTGDFKIATFPAARPILRLLGYLYTATASRHAIGRADILPIEQYAAIRRERRREVSRLKQNRRVEVGPFATFYFDGCGR